MNKLCKKEIRYMRKKMIPSQNSDIELLLSILRYDYKFHYVFSLNNETQLKYINFANKIARILQKTGKIVGTVKAAGKEMGIRTCKETINDN